jgi:hypothetical protein
MELTAVWVLDAHGWRTGRSGTSHLPVGGDHYRPGMRALATGLWQWQAPHPEWTPDQAWPQAVSSSAIDDGVHLLLFDPLAVPGEILVLATDREPVVVLTAPWHERDTKTLVERLGASVFRRRTVRTT